MHSSKAFDIINHELLIAKLNAYGFSEIALQIVLIAIFQTGGKEKKVNSSFSNLETPYKSSTGFSVRATLI